MYKYINLGSLIHILEVQYRKTQEELEQYIYIPEVERFLKNRYVDLQEFKKLVRDYKCTDSVAYVQSQLKRKLPTNYSKFYGGICLKQEDYFKISKKIAKIIEYEDACLQEQLLKEEKENLQETLNFDKNYCIPDELEDSQYMFLFD